MRWRDVKQNRVTQTIPEKKEEDLSHYAPINKKIKAFITDTFLLAVPIFYIIIYLVMGDRESFQNNLLLGWLYILAPLGTIIILFYIINGQTPGMKAYEIKIIDNKTGEKPNIILAFLRFFFFNLVLLSIIGLFTSFFRKDRRGLHDILSGTSLVKTT